MTTFDLTGWTRLSVTGADAAKFLQSFCTNDLLKTFAANAPGCEAFFTSEKARVLGHGWLLRGDPDTNPAGVEFVGTPGQGPGLIAHLAKYALMEDVAFADQTGAPVTFTTEADGWPSGDPLTAGTFTFPSEPTGEPLTDAARIAAKLPAVGVDLTGRAPLHGSGSPVGDLLHQGVLPRPGAGRPGASAGPGEQVAAGNQAPPRFAVAAGRRAGDL